jgi:hypothetical protein
MTDFKTDYPVLKSEHIANARLFANRFDMMNALGGVRKNVAEIGVALGDGSKALIEAFKPSEFVAFDLFTLHEVPQFWGRTNKEWFGEKDHATYYRDKVKPFVKKLVIEMGDSSSALNKYPEAHFDMIYIDGDHGYEGARNDAYAALRTIKSDGLLIFNDYIVRDSFSTERYGVVPVVNDVIVNHGWKVVGFAFQEQMFCDIALAKVPDTAYQG